MGWLLWLFVIVVAVGDFLLGGSGHLQCAGATEGCGDPAAYWTTVTTDGVEGVILPQAAVRELTSWGSDGPIEGVWTPSQADIAALESRIEVAAKTSTSPSSGPLPESLASYVRQYAGIVEGGEKKIFVNGLCSVEDEGWQHHAIVVMDGGNCYFQAVYNVETDRFERFQYNGDA